MCKRVRDKTYCEFSDRRSTILIDFDLRHLENNRSVTVAENVGDSKNVIGLDLSFRDGMTGFG